MQKLEVLAIMKGGRKKFPPFKRGGGREKFYPVLRGGEQNVSDPRFSHFVAPRPVINDQSLTALVLDQLIFYHISPPCNLHPRPASSRYPNERLCMALI